MPVATNINARKRRCFDTWNFGTHCREGGQRSENSNLSIKRRIMLDSDLRSEKTKRRTGIVRSTDHRLVDNAWYALTPKGHIYTQYKVTQYEDHFSQHVQLQTEMIHVLGVVYQDVVLTWPTITDTRQPSTRKRRRRQHHHW